MNPLCCIAPACINRGDVAGNVSSKSLVAAAEAAAEVEKREEVETVVAGILYKRVNYGKGWRARWFVLRNGVRATIRCTGRTKISVGSVCEGGGVRLIGDDSLRGVRRERYWGNGVAGAEAGIKQWKPFGDIHLKVSSIRASKSDDKRLYIFTGTKTLHLRCDSREDRSA